MKRSLQVGAIGWVGHPQGRENRSYPGTLYSPSGWNQGDVEESRGDQAVWKGDGHWGKPCKPR